MDWKGPFSDLVQLGLQMKQRWPQFLCSQNAERSSAESPSTMASSKNGGGEAKGKGASGTKTIAKAKGERRSTRRSSRGVEQKEETNHKRKISNGSAKESAVLPISISSTDSQRDDLEDERAETTSRRANGSVWKSKKGRGKQEVKLANGFGERGDGKEDEKIYHFPLHRVKTIMKSENSDLRINQDALFLVNKATEKFLQHLCQEAYAYSAKDRKKSVAYKNLSSVVGKQKRYDFLSDFVPEKLKAEDALAERQLAEAEAS